MPDGYTHDPDAFDDGGDGTVEPDADGGDGTVEPDADGGDGTVEPDADVGGLPTDEQPSSTAREQRRPEAVEREFDWRGWTVVVGIVVAFLVIPSIIYLYPHVGPMFGLTFWDTYLALPMIPAVLLALLAVWATTRP